MAKKEGKTYLVSFKGNQLLIETDRTRPQALEALLTLIYREWNKVNPERLDAFMQRANDQHKRIKEKLQPREPEPEMEILDFNFWESMMQRIREP
ncbi:hypothetical protein FHS16_001752 [Paenibacillus endophyticus]|uniref:Uncharacterized protein n=1 Tax=Paenibacillus endophyticus TaxID=1294268 RepID=A0A7W5G9J0_9BACL|nr:hypothetical protein [Paenibacillus endophyticus]MBB3151706.1 hypothetical protein [Paenibacillus endophyticus]